MTRFARRWWLRSARRLGHVGMAAAILLLVAVGAAASLPLLLERERAATRSLSIAQRLGAVHVPAAAPIPTQAQLLHTFVGGFPPLEQNASDIAEVFASAELHHVALPKGEYKFEGDPASAIVSYSATFPLRGDYQNLKDFCADVLSALPHAAIDELRISRDNAGNPSLDAVVRFTFFYRAH